MALKIPEDAKINSHGYERTIIKASQLLEWELNMLTRLLQEFKEEDKKLAHHYQNIQNMKILFNNQEHRVRVYNLEKMNHKTGTESKQELLIMDIITSYLKMIVDAGNAGEKQNGKLENK